MQRLSEPKSLHYGATAACHIAGELIDDAAQYSDSLDFDTDPEPAMKILAKAINSNVNKNIKNYANTTIGEASRLFYAPIVNETIEKILFVSLLPRTAPRFNKKGEVVGFDDVKSAKDRTNIKPVLKRQYGNKVQSIDLFYTIDNVRKGLTNEDYNTITPSFIDSFVFEV